MYNILSFGLGLIHNKTNTCTHFMPLALGYIMTFEKPLPSLSLVGMKPRKDMQVSCCRNMTKIHA